MESLKMWHVIAIQTEPLTRRSYTPVALGKGKIAMTPHDEVTPSPIKVELVIQRCETEEFARKMAGAYFGSVKHSIVVVAEIVSPLQVVLAWKGGAILF